MRILFLLGFLTLSFFGAPALAGEVTPFKECATIRNMADQLVTGVVRTASFKATNGLVRNHEGNFRLEDGETVEICSSGPFYPGYKVEFVIRTIMPLFTCQTRLSGEIIIRRKTNEDGIKILYADCK